jgi:ATP-dependent helicase/DNAse subunit B
MLLLSGPPGAGSNVRIWDEVRASVARGDADFHLLVPTSTLAEHLRHQLARAGLVVRPERVLTLAGFLDQWTEGTPAVATAALELVLAEVLERDTPAAFGKVGRLAGFRASLARAITEVSDTGFGARRLAEVLQLGAVEAPLAPAFLAVYREVEDELERRGWVLRAGLLERAARRIRERGLGGVGRVFLDGFFSFSEPELGLLRALAAHADLTVVLPRWAGAEHARAALLEMGLVEHDSPPPARLPARVLVAAAGLEQEAIDIARRIVEHVAEGRQFREIGIVLRGEKPYVPVLRTALERFGIPARFYFAPPLAAHALVRYFNCLVEALLDGCDHAAVLAALRMTASGSAGTPAADEFDFNVRELLPGRGLPALRELAPEGPLRAFLDRLEALEEWRSLELAPQDWVERLKTLAALIEPPVIDDGYTFDTVALWRAQAAALEAFVRALETTAAALPAGRAVTLAAFWDALGLVLDDTSLRVPDRRRNVVAVLDVFEARQWELPVVFLPGLLERQFPLYQSPDPFFPDAAREALRASGLRLDTTSDLRRRERFLFDLSATRATAELVLSYPESNAKGDPNLRSFFLDEFPDAPVQPRAARPALDSSRRSSGAPALVRHPELLARLCATHGTFRPTALEDFLQCPFKFFGQHTLKLEGPPPRPEERLDPLVRGDIAHQALAAWQRGEHPLDAVFEAVFARVCAHARAPQGCGAELVRLRMLEDLRRLTADPPRLEGWSSRAEEDIQFDLEGGTRIRGRIDRCDVSPQNAAVVFDFKYSSKSGIGKRKAGYEQGRFVQGALYLLGLEAREGCRPVGWFYWGFRKETSVTGWHALAREEWRGPGVACTAEELRERLEQARAAALDAARQIREGRLEANPADPDRCQYCPFRDACRIRAAGRFMVATGGAE